MNREHAPLYEQLKKHSIYGAHSFHVPGHKYGQGIEGEAQIDYQAIMRLDVTELSGLDDLHHPKGVIEEAQRLAANCFGAEETFFLVNGSTVGNLSALLSVCSQNDIIIVQRNAHKSVIHGLMLARARAVFIQPQVDLHSGIATGVNIADIEAAIRTYPEAKAVFLTNPNYYGMGVDLKPIIQMIHSYHKIVIVDEAHGAHYGFHPELPTTALAAGADIVVQSTHKMLTALTMGSMLHIQGCRVDRDKLRLLLSMLQSSSPSYPVMASLDLARRKLHVEGEAAFTKGLQVVHYFHGQLLKLPCFERIQYQESNSDYTSLDPFKISLWDRTGTLSGYELQEALEKEGCYAEMADPKHVVLVFSLASTIEDAKQLVKALMHIAHSHHLKVNQTERVDQPPTLHSYNTISSLVSFGLHVQGVVKSVALSDATHAISAEMIIPYPPGIPILYPGERIEPETVELLQKLITSKAKFQGIIGELHFIKVNKERGE